MYLGLVLGLGQVNQAATLGPPSPNRSANITGVGATASAGIVTSGNRSVNVLGISSSGTAGAVTVSISGGSIALKADFSASANESWFFY